MSTPIKYNIALADDHAIIRSGLEILISSFLKNVHFYHITNKKELFEYLNDVKIDLIILDLNFEEGNSIMWLEEIRKNNTECKIVVFSSFDETIYKNRTISLGADAYLSKLSMPDEIQKTIENVLNNNKREAVEKDSNSNSTLNLLSNREMEVALLMIKGYGNLEISNELNIKSNTISTYKQRIYEKLNINSLSELIEVFKINHT